MPMEVTEHPAAPDGPQSRLGGVHNDRTQPAQGYQDETRGARGEDEDTPPAPRPGFAEGQKMPPSAAQQRTEEALGREQEALSRGGELGRDTERQVAVGRKRKDRDI